MAKQIMRYNASAGTLTVALPSGVERLYPNVNSRMLDRILSGKPERIDRKIDRMLGSILIRRKAR